MTVINIAIADGVDVARGADTDALDTEYQQAAIADARTLIDKPPGSGPVRGVWVYGGDKYAFRDNVAQDACIMYKSTTEGWAAQVLSRQIYFTLGTIAIVEGTTLSGGTSGASATISRVILQSGSYSGGDAAGYMVLDGQNGTFTTETASGATIQGDSVQNTFPPGGKYYFANQNFYGATNLKRMYGVNGVGNGFEWDGTTLTLIDTGMVDDKPNHIGVYKNHLFMSFPGGSVQHSGTGTPLLWTLVFGAGEIGVGDDVTGFMPGYATALIIFTRNKVLTLTGDDSSNWVLSTLNEDSGAIEGTAQVVTTGLYLDDEGVRDIRAAQEYGDFGLGTISTLVRPILLQKIKQGLTVKASLRVKRKNQYRIYWSDGTFAIFDFSKQVPEATFCNYDAIVNCTCSSEDSFGNEILLFGAEDGYVYQMDAGTSFDGASFISYFRLPYNHLGAPTHFKRWHKATLEIDAAPQATLYVLADYSYGNPDQPIATEEQFDVRSGGGVFNVDNWDQFYWSSQVEGLAEVRLAGIGTNISLTIYSESATEEPHTISGVTLHYSGRRMQR